MDVNVLTSSPDMPDIDAGMLDVRRRRALARLGLGASAAYVAPTLLALRSFSGSGAVPQRLTQAA